MSNCNHFWVERKDGYEEQCTPAICLVCGEYGCFCKLNNPSERRKELFEQLGINGNNHELQKRLKNEKNNI